jgi:hypothetical protein
MKITSKALAAASICALLIPLGMDSASAGQTTSRGAPKTCKQLGGEFTWLAGHIGYQCTSAEGFTLEVMDSRGPLDQCWRWGGTTFNSYPVGTSDAYYSCYA